MRWDFIFFVTGALMACVGLSMLPALGFSWYYDEGGLMPLALSAGLTCMAGAALLLAFRERSRRAPLSHREGMAITALAWIAAGLCGALPFYFAGSFGNFTDCLFESLSGFTTTGASVFTDIEAQPRGLLFWRSLTHWLGGMGIIVLSLAILPFLGIGGMQLYKAEVPGPTPDKLRPRVKDTAAVLWKVYLLLTAAQTVLLMLGGMNLFDSLCHTFGTVATGGFSTKNASIGYYQSAYIELVITVFMLLAGVNFTLHYLALKGRLSDVWRNPELKFYLSIFLAFFAVITVSLTLSGGQENLPRAALDSAFQTASILTTTGFATADFEAWPALTQAILLLCMFIGGSAGSTAGGMKCMRILLLLRQSYQEIIRLIHPRAVVHVKFGGRVVPGDVMGGVWGFSVLWLGLLFLSVFLVAASGVDLMTSFTSVLACIGNIGPGLGSVGPAENYAHLPAFAKWVLIWCMLLGRLEIYTVIVLFVPEFYRK